MITFTAAYGTEDRTVELSMPMGVGGQVYYIYENRYYLDVVLLRRGHWQTLAQDPGRFTIDDMQILADIVEEHNPASGND